MNILTIIKHVAILRDHSSPRDLPGITTVLKQLFFIKDETKESFNPYMELGKIKLDMERLKAFHYSELRAMTERYEHADDARIKYQRRLQRLKELMVIKYVARGFTPVEVNIGEYHFDFRIDMCKQQFEDTYEAAVAHVTSKKMNDQNTKSTLKARLISYYTGLGFIVKDR